MSAFTSIKVNANTVVLGPGLSWFDVNTALEPYGKAVVGGRMKTIGVAGLCLGGGMSYFNAKYGFAMDQIAAYEIVLASGLVVTASATSNSDLFWALKGGGNNYGIVTAFTLNTFSAPQISTTIQSIAQPNIPQFIGAIADLALYQDTVDEAAGGIFIVLWSGLATNAFTGTFLGVQVGNVENPPVFHNFSVIPSEFAVYNTTTLAQWSSTLDTPDGLTR
jgi:FAD/FMN-containing dehydrogenase